MSRAAWARQDKLHMDAKTMKRKAIMYVLRNKNIRPPFVSGQVARLFQIRRSSGKLSSLCV
jgi:hypothetical protein